MEAKVICKGFNKIHVIDKKRSEVEAVVMMKFGDEQSSLLDKFERLSFEVQLNKAMQLDRSRSEPGAMARRARLPLPLPPPAGTPENNFPAEIPSAGPELTSHVRQGWRRRRPSLKSVLKRLLKPIVIGRSGVKKGVEVVADPKDPMFWKSFSRSMRF